MREGTFLKQKACDRRERGKEEKDLLVECFHLRLKEEEQYQQLMRSRGTHSQPIDPSPAEVQAAMQVLQSRYTQSSAYKVIRQLYLRLIPQNLLQSKRKVPHQATQQQIKEALYLCSPLSKIEKNISTIDSLSKFVGLKKIFLRSAWHPPSFSDPEQAHYYILKTYAARSFAYRGHSVFDFRAELAANKQPIFEDDKKYYYSLEAVIVEAYKFLEQFLRVDCGIGIQILVRSQLKVICNRLFHCREVFLQDDCLAFLSIVKLLYGLEDVTLEEYAAVKIYTLTQKGLRLMLLKRLKANEQKQSKKIPTFKAKSVDTKQLIYEKTAQGRGVDLQSIWSTKLQLQFIECFKKHRNFLHIKQHLIAKYPKFTHLFAGTALRNRFHQILRAAMRKVREIVGSTSIAIELVKLDDGRIRYVMKSSRSLKARLMLLDVYLQPIRVYSSKIEAVVLEINAAIADKSSYKFKWKESSTNDEKGSLISQEDKQSVRILKLRGPKSAVLNHLYQKDESKFRRIKWEEEKGSEQHYELSSQDAEQQTSYDMKFIAEEEDEYGSQFYRQDQ